MNLLLRAVLFLVLLSKLPTQAQERLTATFSAPSPSELTMNMYTKDPEAAGVVLFESGSYHVTLEDDKLWLIKEVHVKIKVFNTVSFEQNVIEIPLYGNRVRGETLIELEAITHHREKTTILKKSNIFSEEVKKDLVVKKFTFPDIQNGSILEYRYKTRSPYFRFVDDWKFQGNLPKLYSEFVTEIPANFVYNKTIIGDVDFYIQQEFIKEDCLAIPNATNAACIISTFAMKDVPAFKSEKHMLSEDNYTTRLKYDLKEFYELNGNLRKFSSDWGDVEKELKKDKDLGKQMGYTSFFKKRLPDSILNERDKLLAAKNVYYFIQNHFSFNGKYRFLSDIRVKDAFEAKTGNSGEINIALYNALEAANLQANIVLTTTRSEALPSNVYPQLFDFNYSIVAVNINGNRILLDATDKTIPFGMLPYRALNQRGRLLDFESGSSWITIAPHLKNTTVVNASLIMDTVGKIRGTVKESNSGYKASALRSELAASSKIDYLNKKTSNKFSISDFKTEHLVTLDKPLVEKYVVSYSPEEIESKFYIHPFLLKTFYEENPFRVEERKYAVDFGYPFSDGYVFKLQVPKGYRFKDVPKNRHFKLPDDKGEWSILYNINNGNDLYLRFIVSLNAYYFSPNEYETLKKFFDSLVSILNKEVMVLEKV